MYLMYLRDHHLKPMLHGIESASERNNLRISQPTSFHGELLEAWQGDRSRYMEETFGNPGKAVAAQPGTRGSWLSGSERIRQAENLLFTQSANPFGDNIYGADYSHGKESGTRAGFAGDRHDHVDDGIVYGKSLKHRDSLPATYDAVKATGDRQEMNKYFIAQALECARLAAIQQEVAKDNLLAQAGTDARFKYQGRVVDSSDCSRDITVYPGVSPEYRARVESWWRSVPDNIRDTATLAGVRIVVVNRAEQIRRSAGTEQARRHAAGERVSQLGGYYDPSLKAVVLIEHPDSTPGLKATQEVENANGVHDYRMNMYPLDETAWHELGHALDFAAMKHISASKEVDDAFHKGLPRVKGYDRQFWRYYVEPDKTGNYQAAKEELLAKSSSSNTNQFQMMRKRHYGMHSRKLSVCWTGTGCEYFLDMPKMRSCWDLSSSKSNRHHPPSLRL